MIAVFGDYIEDVYVYGQVNKISPESPIPIFEELYRRSCDGGAGNVVCNLRALGNSPLFFYSHNSTKTRYVCDNHILFRTDNEIKKSYDDSLDFDLRGVRYCILSDYNKGYLNKSQEFVDYCINKGCKVIVDPKRSLTFYKNATIVKMNSKELQEYAPANLALSDIRKMYNIGAIIVTLGENGVMISSDEGDLTISADRHQVADVTGAGDVFVAVMTHYLNNGQSLIEACSKACKLASISVTKFGTYVLQEEDIRQVKTVFTNGCFDILHKGHVDYLKKSKALGNKLIVGLNSDESIKSLKGTLRPINTQEDRKSVLESLSCVDEVVIFDEDTPYELIKQIKPDLITKGGDYTIDTVVGNDIANVMIIPLIHGYSTTNIVEKLSNI